MFPIRKEKQSDLLKSKLKIISYKAPIINLILIMGVLFICSNQILSQEQQNDLLLDSLLTEGRALTKKGEYQKSDSVLTVARAIALKKQNWSKWFVSISRSLKNKSSTAQIEETTADLLSAIEILPKSEAYILGQLNFKIGYNYQNLGKAEKAIFYFKRANTIFDDLLKSNCSERLFNIYYIQTKDNLATNYTRIGDNSSALKFSSEGFNHARDIKDTFRMRNLSLAQGKYLFHDNQNEEAIKQYEYCLIIGVNKADVNPYLAEVFLSDSNLVQAKKYLLEDKPSQLTIDYFINLSHYYKQVGNKDLAIQYYLKGLELLKNNRYMPFRKVVKNTIEYAQMLDEFGKNNEAVNIAHSVLKEVYSEVDSLDLYSRAPETQSFPDIWVIEALYLKAKYFKSKYETEGQQNDLIESKYYYDLLLSHLDKLKLNYNSINSQYRIGSYSQKIYAEAIKFYSNLYMDSNDRTHFDNALRLSQNANSFVLKNAISIRKALEVSKVSADSINQYLTLAFNAGSEEEVEPGNENPIIIFDKFNDELIKNNPSLKKYQQENALSLNHIQNTLDDKDILIKYFSFENTLIRFAISKNHIYVDNIELDTVLYKLLKVNEELNISSKNWNESQYKRNSKSLYGILLEKVLSRPKFANKAHLYIVPDGPLKNLSFSSLVTSNSSSPLNAEDYLINNYAISYLYYCAQLTQENKDYEFKGQFVGFGLEYEDAFLKEIIEDFKSNEDKTWDGNRSFTLEKLEFADDETKEIANILNGESIVNEEATLDVVMKKIKDFSILHFSTHALLDMDDYLNSSIVLNKDPHDNHQLKYQDILNLNLNSELVVLSACQTGIGKSISGEGLVSLSQAFIQSGCKSAVGAYWKVPDESTKKVMNLFYSNLKDGMEKSKALQTAQLEYMNNEELSTPRSRSPQHWASWVIYGQDVPIPKKSFLSNYLYPIYAIGILILIFLATLLFVRKQQSKVT